MGILRFQILESLQGVAGISGAQIVKCAVQAGEKLLGYRNVRLGPPAALMSCRSTDSAKIFPIWVLVPTTFV